MYLSSLLRVFHSQNWSFTRLYEAIYLRVQNKVKIVSLPAISKKYWEPCTLQTSLKYLSKLYLLLYFCGVFAFIDC